MIKIIEDKKYDLCNFGPFVDYIKELEKNKLYFSKVNDENGWLEIHFKCLKKYYKILIMKDDKMEWATILVFNDKKELNRKEQIEFCIYSEDYKNTLNRSYDSIVKYSAHFEDEQFTKMIFSCYMYNKNELISSMRKKRKFAVEEFKKVYHNGMNLTELVSIADDKIFEFYEAIDERDEAKELKLYY